ncbi:hypothetical protein ACO0QE_001586 [Hanseniaspora vineae]
MGKFLFINAKQNDVCEVVEKVKALDKKAGPFDLVMNVEPCTAAPLKIQKEALKRLYFLESTKKNKSRPEEQLADETEQIKDYSTLSEPFGVIEIENICKIAYINFNKKSDSQNCIKFFEDLNGFVNILVIFCNSPEHEKTVASVIKLKQPHYVIRGAGPNEENQFIEMQPFIWESTTLNRVTREVHLAQFNKGKKWAYAFNYDASKEPELPTALRINPYTASPKIKKRKHEMIDSAEVTERLQKKIKELKSIAPSKCHFCFTNENVQDHMIISISESSYLTIAKGPLCVPQSGLTFPGHCIIPSIEHVPKLNSVIKPFTDLHKSSIYLDICKFENSLVQMFSKFDMFVVSFEINSVNSVHYHTQVFPVPKKYGTKIFVAIERQINFSNSRNQNPEEQLSLLKFANDKDKEYLKIVNNHESNYFQFKVYNTRGSFELYVIKIDPNKRLDLQFGRRVLAFVLNQPKRVLWNSPVCLETQEQETKNVENFQKEYKEFDFTS